MRPTDNAVLTVKAIWKSAREFGNRPDDWRRAHYQFVGIWLYLSDITKKPSADRLYLDDMMIEALDMMENCR